VSGLYFRGKVAYADAFGRPPSGLAGALVISPGAGLRFLHEQVTLARLAEWSQVPIDATNPRFTRPLVRHARALEQAHGRTTRFVLLGSVATDKYVQPLTKVFGDRLLFPTDFVGRGDMSRGALLLRAARAGRELAYEPVAGARRHGPRAPGVAPRRGQAPGPAARRVGAAPEVAMRAGARPEVVILVGLPGAGKTTFFQQRFADTYVHVSKDRLPNNRRPARRQAELIAEALAGGRPVVVDNTNATPAERSAVIAQARANRARVIGFVFDCTTRACVARNAAREGRARIPNVGIFATAKRFVRPVREEGFDELYVVRPLAGPRFEVRSA
jgi:predicted kinase